MRLGIENTRFHKYLYIVDGANKRYFTLEEIKNNLHGFIQSVNYRLNKQANQIRSLEEQLKNAVVPKFKIGQEVFTFIDNDIKSGYIESITKDFNSIMYQIVNYKSKYMSNYFYKKEELLYATREEAEKRLAELKGE